MPWWAGALGPIVALAFALAASWFLQRWAGSARRTQLLGYEGLHWTERARRAATLRAAADAAKGCATTLALIAGCICQGLASHLPLFVAALPIAAVVWHSATQRAQLETVLLGRTVPSRDVLLSSFAHWFVLRAYAV